MTLLLILIFFTAGLYLRPFLSKKFKSIFAPELNRYEITFKMEFYSYPSIHHRGEKGVLTKSDPIKIQVDAENQEEALSAVESIVKQKTTTELVSIKEIPIL